MDKFNIRSLTLTLPKIKQSNFVKNTLKIASGNIIAQLLSIVFVLINTRLYGPQYFGELGIFTSTYTIINSLVSLGFVSAIISPKEDKVASAVYKICLVSVLSLSSLLFIIVLIISPWIKIINLENNYYMICTMLLVILITNNLVSMKSTIANRREAYKVLFWNPIIAVIINFLIAFILAFTEFKEYGLILGMIGNQVVIFLYMSIVLKTKKYTHSIQDLKKIFTRYSDFPKYLMTSNLIKGLSQNAPLLLMAGLFGEIFIGQYSMGQRLLFMPIVFVGSALGQVHFKQATDLVNSGKDPGEITYKVIKMVIMICFIPFLLMGIFGDVIFRVLLGNEWELSGELVKIRALEFLFTGMFFSTSYILVVIKKQRLSLIYTSITLIVNFLMIYLGGVFIDDSIITVVLLSLANIVLYIILYYYVFKYTALGVKPYIKLISISIMIFIVLQIIGNAIF